MAPNRVRRNYATKYELDEDYFREIDTEEKAYWLGFIAADGCVTTVGPARRRTLRFHLSVAVRDAAHLDAFRKSIGWTGPIAVRVRQSPRSDRQCTQRIISIGRTEFCRRLAEHGIVRRKSWTCQPPGDDVPPHLLRHYWRGHFDGDGWLCVPTGKATRKAWHLGLVGTKDIIVAFTKFVGEIIPPPVPRPDEDSLAWDVVVRGIHRVKAVARLLYHEAAVALPRKQDLASRVLVVQTKLPPFRLRPITHAGETLPARVWADRLGINYTTVLYRLDRGLPPEQVLRVKPARV